MTEEKEVWSPVEERSVVFYFTFIASAEFFLLHTFEGEHDVLVLSHLQGVDLVSGISGSGDFSHLATSTRRWMEGEVVMETGHCNGTRCRLQHRLWKAFIDSCPNELISGLLLGCPLSRYKGSWILCRWKDGSRLFSSKQFQCAGLINARLLLLCPPLSIIFRTGHRSP